MEYRPSWCIQVPAHEGTSGRNEQTGLAGYYNNDFTSFTNRCSSLFQSEVQPASHLQNVVQSQVSEALAGDAQCAGGFFHFVRFVPGRLGVLHLRDFHVLPHLVKVFLGLLELANIAVG